MTTMVLGASVIVKWIFADRAEEAHSLQALHILQLIKERGSRKFGQCDKW